MTLKLLLKINKLGTLALLWMKLILKKKNV